MYISNNGLSKGDTGGTSKYNKLTNKSQPSKILRLPISLTHKIQDMHMGTHP
jgi:hypothetical protein